MAISPLRTRTARVGVLVTAGLLAAAVPTLTRATAPTGLANGGFESADLGGWRATPGTTLRRTAAAYEGAGALDVTVGGPGGGVTTTATAPTAERRLATLVVRGHPAAVGKRVVLTVGDATTGAAASSAPVTLQPWWQTVGVRTPTAVSNLQLAVTADGTDWAPGDTFTVDAAALAGGGPTPTRTRGRELLVNGQPFIMNAVFYAPSPPGGTPWTQFWNDPAQCQSDAQLLRAGGFNTLRIWLLPERYDAATYQRCMDAFAAAGLRLMWLVQPPGGVQYNARSQAYIDAYWIVLSRAINLVKDHPATIGWNIGNEINFGQWDSGGWFDQVDQLAARAKQLDPLHVTTTSLSANQFFDKNFIRVSPTIAKNVDMWGLNHFAPYPAGYDANTFNVIANQDPTRPVWISEYGVDRYTCVDPGPTRGANGIDGTTCGPRSRDDPATQAAWDAANLRQLVAHVVPNNPRGIVGTTVFMWSDLWWFAAGFAGVGTPATRDVSGLYNGWTRGQFPDGHDSSDFYGITHALAAGAPGPRVTTATYDAIATVFRGPGLGMSKPTVQVERCEATVHFATSAPAFGRVDFGTPRRIAVNGQIVSEDLVIDRFLQSTAPATQHAIRLTGLSPGTTYTVHARAFDAAGRPVSPDPVTISVPFGTC